MAERDGQVRRRDPRGDDRGVAAGDIVEIGVGPPRAGRLSLTLAYRAGLMKTKTSYWVEPEYEAALRRLADAVTQTRGEA
jgi:hypothetical protein